MGAIGKQPDQFQQQGSGLSPSVTCGRYSLNTYGDLLPQRLQLWQAGGTLGLMDETLNRRELRIQPPAGDAAEESQSPAIVDCWGGYPPIRPIKIVESWAEQIGLRAH
jgi:hypothetical protein